MTLYLRNDFGFKGFWVSELIHFGKHKFNTGEKCFLKEKIYARKKKEICQKTKRGRTKINLKEKMAELLELPKEIVLDLPKITCSETKILL